MTIRSIFFACILCGFAAGFACASGAATAAAPGTPLVLTSTQAITGLLDRSLANESNAAIKRGLDWLADQQREDGSWSSSDYPALTGLPLWAFAHGGDYPRAKPVIDKAVKHILSYIQPDGGIYKPAPGAKGGGLATYNTAICMVALNAVGDPALAPVIHKARQFMAASQHLGDDAYYGGMGYDANSGTPYADLSNSVLAYEAMRLTQNVEDLNSSATARADLNWEAARKFLAQVQNNPEAGTNEAGGFFYRPGASNAGVTTNNAGVVVFRSYGSMTYAGILSLIYADVKRDDPRAQAAFEWAARHWTLDENPGVGPEGLYYFYSILTKALAAFGQTQVPLSNGSTLDWRTAVTHKLVNLQKIDAKTGHGYWVNDAGRWMESDKVLVTSYAVLALQMAAGE